MPFQKKKKKDWTTGWREGHEGIKIAEQQLPHLDHPAAPDDHLHNATTIICNEMISWKNREALECHHYDLMQVFKKIWRLSTGR
jgi:hypothetical protein